MRSRIMVIGRDVGSRARLARLLSRESYRAEVAESFAHARRAGLDGVALAIVANELDGLKRRRSRNCGSRSAAFSSSRRAGSAQLLRTSWTYQTSPACSRASRKR
jgi:hypothetical protein